MRKHSPIQTSHDESVKRKQITQIHLSVEWQKRIKLIQRILVSLYPFEIGRFLHRIRIHWWSIGELKKWEIFVWMWQRNLSMGPRNLTNSVCLQIRMMWNNSERLLIPSTHIDFIAIDVNRNIFEFKWMAFYVYLRSRFIFTHWTSVIDVNGRLDAIHLLWLFFTSFPCTCAVRFA